MDIPLTDPSAVWHDRYCMVYELHREQWLPRTIEEVFPFFADAGNLERITPPWLHFQIIDPPGNLGKGTRIDYRLRIHGFPVRWQSEITAWEPPYRFIDEQTQGPYRLWVHEHTFESKDGGTMIRDHVRYAVPGGTLIQKFLVAPDLERVFSYRLERLREIWPARKSPQPPGE